jgi:hypothetical protein
MGIKHQELGDNPQKWLMNVFLNHQKLGFFSIKKGELHHPPVIKHIKGKIHYK